MPKMLRVRDLLRGFFSFLDEAFPSSRYLALWILLRPLVSSGFNSRANYGKGTYQLLPTMLIPLASASL